MSTQTVQTIFNLNGVANGSPLGFQQPAINFTDLPFGPWGTLSTPVNATGHLIGIANPSQYKVGLFAAESETQFLSGQSMLVSVNSDGSFSVPVSQSAVSFVAALMTPDFASNYYSSNFPSGNGTGITSSLPLPKDDPQNIPLLIQVPAGFNRTLWVGRSPFYPMFSVAPGTSWNTSTGISALLKPNTNNQPPDPTNPSLFPQLWQFLQGEGPQQLSYFIGAQDSSGQQTKGALVISLYIYQNTMYLIAGYGPLNGASSIIQPNFVSTPIVSWQAFPPSVVQIGCAVTVLSDDILLAIDEYNVEQSVMSNFLQIYERIVKDTLKVIFATI